MNRHLPLEGVAPVWQDGTVMSECANQFSLTRAAPVRHEVVFETAWLDWNPDQVLRVAAGVLKHLTASTAPPPGEAAEGSPGDLTARNNATGSPTPCSGPGRV